jgi:hypothetical protein
MTQGNIKISTTQNIITKKEEKEEKEEERPSMEKVEP